jgi:hypothetical protein
MKKSNYVLTVFIGDTDNSLVVSAQQHDSTAFLVDSTNYKKILQEDLLNDTTIYTSLGYLPKDSTILLKILLLAGNVFYCPPVVWSDKKNIDVIFPTTCIQGLTENLLLFLPRGKKIYNFDRNNLVPDPIELVDTRKTDDPQIWGVGCSFTHGLGVKENERYMYHVAEALNLPCSFLTRNGSAIDWASDQITRSDIRPGDLVIWGLTAGERLTFVHENKLLKGITSMNYAGKNLESIVPEKTLLLENTFYNHIYSIKRAINFCKKCQARLVIIGLLTSESIIRYLANVPEYHHYLYEYNYIHDLNILARQFKDLGSDEEHPGPLQHKLYADFILKII